MEAAGYGGPYTNPQQIMYGAFGDLVSAGNELIRKAENTVSGVWKSTTEVTNNVYNKIFGIEVKTSFSTKTDVEVEIKSESASFFDYVKANNSGVGAPALIKFKTTEKITTSTSTEVEGQIKGNTASVQEKKSVEVLTGEVTQEIKGKVKGNYRGAKVEGGLTVSASSKGKMGIKAEAAAGTDNLKAKAEVGYTRDG